VVGGRWGEKIERNTNARIAIERPRACVDARAPHPVLTRSGRAEADNAIIAHEEAQKGLRQSYVRGSWDAGGSGGAEPVVGRTKKGGGETLGAQLRF